MSREQPLLRRFSWLRAAIAATLGSCLVCVLLVPDALHALDPDKHVTQYMHTSWRIQDGSAPAGMAAITQTSDGFLWFASTSGDIYRFDGVRFLPSALSTHARLISTVYNLYGDHAGGLWAEGNRDIVHRKNAGVTSHFELQGLLGFQNISENPDGSLWVVRGGLRITEPLCHVSEIAVKCFGKADGIPISPLDSILADGRGGFWLGGETSLVHFHSGASEVYPIPALKSNAGQDGISSLAFGSDGTLWVGMLPTGPGLGLGRLVGGTFKSLVTAGFDGSKLSVIAMISDRDGNLWVATMNRGLFRVHGNTVEHYGRNEGLSSNTVFALFEDREGIVWVATSNGIDSFHDPRVATFSSVEGLGEDEVGGVLASKDGTIWVANTHSLDYIVNGNVSSIRADAGLPGHQVTAMLEDRAGNLWVGVDDGLYLFKNGRFLRLPEPNHTPLGLVDGLAEDVDGNIWAECSGDPPKLVRIRDFQVREEFPASQVPPGHALAADPRGGIWIGTSQGEIALLRNGVLETKFPLNPGGDPSNRQIMAQADGSILAGSENGLVGWREGKVQRLTSKNGLPCDSVISFVEDKEKRWWLFTRCGIVELKDSELQRWWANPDAVVQIRVDDALDGVQPGKPYSNPAAYSSDGRVWFATSVVVQMVDPSKLSRKAVPADTYIESVTVDRKEFAANENLRLGPHPRDLQIDYTSPTFLIPQRVRFRYRLDPYDRDWHDVGIRRQAFYTDLPPGQYTFRVMATSCDDVWNDRAATLAFSVSPAYYQTNWFRVLCAMIFVGLLWVGYQFRIRRLQREFDVTLDARVAERTRIARELHDTLLQSFHGLLLQLQTVSHLLPQGKAKEKLDTTIDQAAEAITEGRDTVQGLRDSTTQTNALALALRALKEELLAGSSGEAPEFRVAVEGEPRDLHPIVRDDIYKLATEALRNAFRHAQAKNVEAQIQYGKEQFRLWIRDDGRGLDPAVLAADGRKGHYGIAGMRERAKAMGGKLEIRSTLNAGTELEVTIPAKTAYSRSPGRSWLTFRLSSK